MNHEQAIEELTETLDCMKYMLELNADRTELTCFACLKTIKKVYEWSISEENK